MTPAERAVAPRRHPASRTRYYVLDAPEIADAEFDALLSELQALEAAHPELVTPDSPTQRVGGRPAEGLPTAAHREPMLSLDNAYDEAELRAFDERLRRALGAGDEALAYVAELKIDGLSIALTYERRPAGPRRHARRRRRGRGRDPQRPHHPRPAADAARRRPAAAIEVRGEVFLPRASFARINREREEAGEPLFANPRNAAAGTMRTLDPALVASARSARVRLSAGGRRAAPEHARRAQRRRSRRSRRGRCRSSRTGGAATASTRVIDFCGEWTDARHDLAFDTDGVVIKLDDIGAARAAGTTAKFPRWATAFKFPAQQAHDQAARRSTSTSAAPAR